MAGRRILITGVGSAIGSGLARRLEADPAVEHVAGLDVRRPSAPLPRTKFIEADVRDPEVAALVPLEEVDTVVHNQIVRRPGPGMSTRTMHDINVIGTLQLLAACETLAVDPGDRDPRLRRHLRRPSPTPRSSSARRWPACFRCGPGSSATWGRSRTTSRPTPAATPAWSARCCATSRRSDRRLDTQVTRYLSLPAAPTYLGFDPRVQLVHEEDGLGALTAAVRRPVRGAVNVASPGTIGLTRMIRLARRPPLPVPGPLFGSVTDGMRRAGLAGLSPDFSRLLRYGRGVDTTRLVDEVGFSPRFTTASAVEDWVGARA